MDLTTLTAADILGISDDFPEKLYSFNHAKDEYRKLCSIWHPDRNTDSQAVQVFQQIKHLYDIAEKRITNDMWCGPAELIITSNEGKQFKFKYRKAVDITIGKLYIGMKFLVYVIDNDNKDLFDNGIKMIKSIKYSTPKFEEQFKRQMPNIVRVIETPLTSVVVMEKTEELIRLKDLLNYLPDHKLDPKHVAWIMSTLCNMACFFELNGIVHNAITTENFWISPEYHSGVLFDGWWYARRTGEKLLALPSESIAVLPSEVLTEKIAKSKYDRTLIKAVGIESLGDSTRLGSMLLKDKTIPKSVLEWLRNPVASTAVEDYKKWGNARDNGFGERKFIPLTVDITKIY